MHSESKPYFIRSAVLLLLALSAFFLVNGNAIGAGGEVRLTSSSSDEFQPDIDGDKVVWLSGINDPYAWAKWSAVYLHTLGGSTQKINTGAYSYGHQPAIGSSSVVWEDLRNDSGGGTIANTDIYGYALPGGPESGIAVGASDQQEPAVSGGRTVWQAFAGGDSDIYLKDNDGQVYQITTNSSLQSDPRIDGDLIVWKDKRNDGGDVYAYDLSQGTYKQDPRPSPDPAETRITTNGAKQINPDVSGRKIVWTDYRSLIGSAYIYDLDNPVANGSPLDARATHQTGARISGNLVTWVDWRNGNYGDRTNSDIYAANSTSGQVIQITTNAAVQTSPAVSGGRIVWADRRYGHWDVYYKELDVQPPDGTIEINGGAVYADTTASVLTLSASDDDSGVDKMSFSDDNSNWSAWEDFSISKNYSLPSGDGAKTVYVRYLDVAGNVSTGDISDDIVLDQTDPLDPTISGSTPTAGVWTTDNTIEVGWPPIGSPGGASDAGSGVDGFSVSWSNGATEMPDNVKDLEETAEGATSSPRVDGDWWFNLRTRDNAGRWTATVHHGPFKIDTTDPTNPSDPATETAGAKHNIWQSSNSDPDFIWGPGLDNYSGVDGYSIYWGSSADGTATTTYTASPAFDPPAVSDPSVNHLRVKTKDNAGNEAGWETLFTFKYDTTLPTNPTTVTESGGALHDDWQKPVSDPNFTWEGASGGSSVVDGYSVYWGTDSNGTTVTTYTTSEAFDPPAVSSPATYYLRMKTKNQAGGESDWEELFIFRYDATNPANPSAPATELGGATHNTWQKSVSNPNFTWGPGSDANSGVSSYKVYWGTDPAGTPSAFTASAAYDPATVSSPATYYLRVTTVDNAGNESSPVTLFTFKYETVLPINPSALATELGGATHNTWQKSVSNPNFTWGPGSDGDSGVSGYNVYWGTNSAGSPSSWTSSPAFNPAAVGSGVYYLRVKTKDNADNNAAAVTNLFTFKYDNQAPGGSIKINNGSAYTRSPSGWLKLSASDTGGSGLDKVRYRNATGSWGAWGSFASSKSWTLPGSDGTKQVYYGLKDKAGNEKVVSDTIKLDTQRPTVRMVTPFVSTRISKRTTFKVKWSVADPSPSSGMKSVRVYYHPSGSSKWRLWKIATASGEANFTGRAGTTYYFRTLVVDNARNWKWSKTYKTIVPFNEGIYKSRTGFSGYTKSGKSQNFLTSVRYSYGAGHTLIYKLYNNNGIGLVVTKGPKMGRARIYVDGKYMTTVDARSSKTRARQLIYYKGFKTKGTHELKVVNLGTSGRARFEVDAVVVTR